MDNRNKRQQKQQHLSKAIIFKDARRTPRSRVEEQRFIWKGRRKRRQQRQQSPTAP